MDNTNHDCTICGNNVHKCEELSVQYSGQEYYFCSDEHEVIFNRTPENFV